jgi:rhodanese-related sulfurtransferase
MSHTFKSFRPDELENQRQHGVMPQLIDCRSASEFATGHVPGSINIPAEELDARRHDIDAGRPVIFICASGRRAAAAAELVEHGRPVGVLDGGIKAWASSGREVVMNTASRWSLERQVRLVAGTLAALGGIASFIDPRWGLVPVMIGLGLTFAAVSNTCALGEVLMRMPWNRRHI